MVFPNLRLRGIFRVGGSFRSALSQYLELESI